MPRTEEDVLQSEVNAAVAAARLGRDAVVRHLERHRQVVDACRDTMHFLDSASRDVLDAGLIELHDSMRKQADRLAALVRSGRTVPL